METIAQEAKRLLSPIPEEKWMTGWFVNKHGACCAIGHWNKAHGISPTFMNETTALLVNQVKEYSDKRREYLTIQDVNDGFFKAYSQPTPKQRVMALLDDMIAAGY